MFRSRLGIGTMSTGLLLFFALLHLLGTGAAQAQSASCSNGNDAELTLSHARFSLQGSAFAQIQYVAAIAQGELVRSDFTVPRTRVCGSGHAFTSRLRYRLMIGRSVQRSRSTTPL